MKKKVVNDIFVFLFLFLFFISEYVYTQTWTARTNFGGVTRSGAVGFSIGTKGYIGTGGIGISGSYYNDFWQWDQVTNAWT